MESITDTYERYVNEIQFLKKQVSGEKLAHENTLKQLQSAYEIMDEMKDLLRNEQNANFKLKSEVADKSNRMASMSSQYEDQIREIKDMINLKDEELRRMSSVLMVSDYDVIRLKVIN
jgi:cell division septum initiation protein DivIVA